MKHKTEQEDFWAGEFGDNYINRNQGKKLLASNLNFFNRSLQNIGNIESCIEFGANIGMNLQALNLLYPDAKLKGVEINKKAHQYLSKLIGENNAFLGSIFDYSEEEKFDLTLIKGVLIHLNPKMLKQVYKKLYQSSKKYILIAEYYNPVPTKIKYRGHNDKLFKRDFAGEFLDMFSDTRLIDYGFVYHRDYSFPQDDINWFLIKK